MSLKKMTKIRVLELYSGIGGMHCACKGTVINLVKYRLLMEVYACVSTLVRENSH